jgi:hypothetical protein
MVSIEGHAGSTGDRAASTTAAEGTVSEAADLDEKGLGRLHVAGSVREIWAKEASDFTPWLFGNLDLLSEVVGITLTPEAMEHPVGGYRLDILAKDPLGRNVAIENQVEVADHAHLGQLLLYSAHVGAETAVWIAPRFSDQHRQALIWLNESTREGVRFFGVEVSIVRIGNSPHAPVFNVVVRPNELQKSDTTLPQPDVSDAAAARRQFMTSVLNEVVASVPTLRVPTGLSWTSYMNFKSGPFGTYGIAFTKDQRLRVEAYLDASKQVNKALFDEVHTDRQAWEAKVGFPLTWERLDDAKASRMASYLEFWLPGQEVDQDAAKNWAIQQVTALITTFDSTLRSRATELNHELVND